MIRRSIALGLMFAGLMALVAVGQGRGQQAKGKYTLRVLLPQADSTVTVDGKKVKGEGLDRKIELDLPEDKDEVTVKAAWEPNGYTKISRSRKVKVKADDLAFADLSKASAKEPDDIVVIFVPTPDDVVEAMCKMAKVGKDDVVYDLGCGDGRMVIMAVEKFGAKKGVGVDLDPARVKDSDERAKKHGVADKVQFRQGDVLKVSDLSDASVVLLYMGDDINNRLKPILQKTLKPGSRVVSHRFTMGEWEPVKSETIRSKAGYECTIHMWVVGENKKKD